MTLAGQIPVGEIPAGEVLADSVTASESAVAELAPERVVPSAAPPRRSTETPTQLVLTPTELARCHRAMHLALLLAGARLIDPT